MGGERGTLSESPDGKAQVLLIDISSLTRV